MTAPAASISSAAKNVAKCFRDAIQLTTPLAQDLDVDHARIEIDDSFTLFKLWAGNLGVFQAPTDTRSLDYRLRQEPEIHHRVLELLSSLEKLLQSASESITDSHEANTEVIAASPENEAEAFLEQLLSLETSSECQSTWVQVSISDTIRRLFKISALIEKSTASDRYLRAEQKPDCQFSDQYDVAHVAQKHNTAPEWLTKRLGKAITKRRQFLRYADLHRFKLSALPRTTSDLGEKLKDNETLTDRSAALLEELRAPSQHTEPSLHVTEASRLYKINLDHVDDGFDEDRSEFSVATSIRDGRSPDRLRVAKLETITQKGEFFICPYCHTTQKFNGQSNWEQHVYSDLRAYVCTFPECGMRMFEKRSHWIQHEMTEHRRRWTCHLCATKNFQHKRDLQRHLKASHGISGGRDLQTPLIDSGSCIMDVIPVRDCLLCDWHQIIGKLNHQADETLEFTVSHRRFMKHVAGHLEELALFALPTSSTSESDDGAALQDDENSAAAANGTRSSMGASSQLEWDSRSRPSSSLSAPASDLQAPPSDDEVSIVRELGKFRQDMRAEPGPSAQAQSPPEVVLSNQAEGLDQWPGLQWVQSSYWALVPPEVGVLVSRKEGPDRWPDLHWVHRGRGRYRRETNKDAAAVGEAIGSPQRQGFQLAEYPTLADLGYVGHSQGQGAWPLEIHEDLERPQRASRDTVPTPAAPHIHASRSPSSGRGSVDDSRSDHDSEHDPDDSYEPIYCYCNRGSYGPMVACDNRACPVEWFHLGCTELRELPGEKEVWYCNTCFCTLRDLSEEPHGYVL